MILNTVRILRDWFAANFDTCAASVSADASDGALPAIAAFGVDTVDQWAYAEAPERVPALTFASYGSLDVEGQAPTVFRDTTEGGGVAVVVRLFLPAEDTPAAEARLLRYLRAMAKCIERMMATQDPAVLHRNNVAIQGVQRMTYGPTHGVTGDGHLMAGALVVIFAVRDLDPL